MFESSSWHLICHSLYFQGELLLWFFYTEGYILYSSSDQIVYKNVRREVIVYSHLGKKRKKNKPQKNWIWTIFHVLAKELNIMHSQVFASVDVALCAI